MNRRGRRVDLVCSALFTALSVFLAIVISIQLLSINSVRGYRLRMTLGDAAGLTEGSPVKLSGVEVGQVDDVKLDMGKVHVRLTVRNGTRLPSDSEVAIRFRSLIGLRQVVIIPGTGKALLRDGDRLTNIRPAPDVRQLIDQFAPLTRGLNLQSFNKLIAALAEAVQGGSGGISTLLGAAETITKGLADRRDTIGKLINDSARLAEVAARRDEQIGQMVTNLTKLSKAFVDNRTLLSQAADELGALGEATGDLLTGRADELERILRSGSSLGGSIKDSLPQLGDLLKYLRHLLGDRLWESLNRGEYWAPSVTACAWWGPPCPYPIPQPGQWDKGIADFLTRQLKQPQPTADRTIESIKNMLGGQ